MVRVLWEEVLLARVRVKGYRVTGSVLGLGHGGVFWERSSAVEQFLRGCFRSAGWSSRVVKRGRMSCLGETGVVENSLNGWGAVSRWLRMDQSPKWLRGEADKRLMRGKGGGASPPSDPPPL